MKPSDALRRAVRNSGKSRYRIAQETGMTESGLSRFMAGGGINLRSLDRLVTYLGLELIEPRKKTDSGYRQTQSRSVTRS